VAAARRDGVSHVPIGLVGLALSPLSDFSSRAGRVCGSAGTTPEPEDLLTEPTAQTSAAASHGLDEEAVEEPDRGASDTPKSRYFQRSGPAGIGLGSALVTICAAAAPEASRVLIDSAGCLSLPVF